MLENAGSLDVCTDPERGHLTFRAILSAMRRRWYVVVVALLAAGLGFVALFSDGGSYTTKTIVTFLVPATTTLSPDNGSNDRSVIAFARSVAAQVNTGRDPISYSEDDAPYYGAGLRQGVFVDVPSDGNQWYESFNHAEIDIQIVGRTKQWVKQEQARFVTMILGTAEAQQVGLVSDPNQYITAAVVPLTEDITAVEPVRSSQFVALGALLLAGLLVGAWGSVALDRRLSRVRSAHHPVVSSRAPLSLKGSLT
jgi:hypothetical protein